MNIHKTVYETMVVIKAKLTGEQKALFGETCMGNFLDVKNIILSGIFHNMIMWQVYYEDSSSDDEVINIDVCGIVVPFTKVCIAVISGLKIHRDTNIHVVKLGDNILDKYFSSHKVVKREILDVVYNSIHAESDENIMKFTLLYFVAQALLSNAKSMNVPDMYFWLVNDLNAFNAYPSTVTRGVLICGFT
ncbi:LOW QUALITY PROTEIN: hypothetical protein TorRG33x02_216000 [Trema orientale]|uniref:DUF1985 domain-containing protein n=1 Tax=Trema orientale TaxID=63057 RepID=A0A2P5EAN0_TREOI|nr:LOW QUALITY PROTEIN: hypothetical protein TorRG33x02_216000 [Trema orientale]